ncbi:phosphotransferase, partial [Serratia marcescens]
GNFEHCERIIEEVGFPQERILNVSPRRLLDFLERRGKPAIAELADL